MIRSLIVDDEETKVAQISSVIKHEFGDENVEIVSVDNVYDAAVEMRGIAFDLLLIDLNLPMRKGNEPSADGGMKLLRQVARGTDGLQKPSFVVGLTSFEDLAKKNLAEFQLQGWALVQYQVESNSWEQTVANQCQHVAVVQRRYSPGKTECEQSVDVCICTALPEPELTLVIDLFALQLNVYANEMTR